MLPTGKAPAKPQTVPAKDKGEEEWRQPIPIDMRFGAGLKTRPRRNRPMTPSPWGWTIFIFYIISFVFYAYCRIGHTVNRTDPVFAYQVWSDWLVCASGFPCKQDCCHNNRGVADAELLDSSHLFRFKCVFNSARLMGWVQCMMEALWSFVSEGVVGGCCSSKRCRHTI